MALRTFTASAVTSGPIPSPASTAIRYKLCISFIIYILQDRLEKLQQINAVYGKSSSGPGTGGRTLVKLFVLVVYEETLQRLCGDACTSKSSPTSVFQRFCGTRSTVWR